MTPTTAAGRALLDEMHGHKGPCYDSPACPDGLTIAAIEAEAAAPYVAALAAVPSRDSIVIAERARLVEAVRGLEIKDDFGDNWDRPVVCGHIDGDCGFRAAVLALLTEPK